MLHFDSDYMEGAHPAILERLVTTNFVQTAGYGEDEYSKSAKEKIKKACKCDDASVYFLVGGTQSNSTVLDALLKSYEGVISAKTGHINTHESGAVEFSGHKVIELEQHEGKIDADVLNEYLKNFFEDSNYEHMVIPGAVYISYPTEYGTLYTKDELSKISNICRKFDISLFIDGARMGYGIVAKGADITLEYLAQCCDAFYIGGTKVGALFGEAVVIKDSKRISHFKTIIKQHGALLAKGRILGLQFDTLFTDNLYFEIAKHANAMADKLKKAFISKGYRLFLDSTTNQQFVILNNKKIKELENKVTFTFWEKYDETSQVIRFVTSWATKEEDIDKMIELL